MTVDIARTPRRLQRDVKSSGRWPESRVVLPPQPVRRLEADADALLLQLRPETAIAVSRMVGDEAVQAGEAGAARQKARGAARSDESSAGVRGFRKPGVPKGRSACERSRRTAFAAPGLKISPNGLRQNSLVELEARDRFAEPAVFLLELCEPREALRLQAAVIAQPPLQRLQADLLLPLDFLQRDAGGKIDRSPRELSREYRHGCVVFVSCKTCFCDNPGR